MTRTQWINLIGIAGLVFVAVCIGRDRDEIAEALESADPLWLAVSLSSGLCAMTLLGVNWLVIIRHAGSPAPTRRGLNWFFVGQLGKYVPGAIWPIVGQAELAHRAATPRSIAHSTTALSMMTSPLGAGLAVSVAVVSRVVSVAVDLLGAAISIPVSRSAPPTEANESETAACYGAL